MVQTDEQKAFFKEPYFLNGILKMKNGIIMLNAVYIALPRGVALFRQTGSIQQKQGSGGKSQRNPDVIEGRNIYRNL